MFKKLISELVSPRHRQIDNFKPPSFMFSNDWPFQKKHLGEVLFFWLLTYKNENEMDISMTRNFQLYHVYTQSIVLGFL